MTIRCQSFNLFAKRSLTIDDLNCRLNHKWTTSLLVIFGIIVILREYNTDAIDCITSDKHPYRQQSDSVNSFCWLRRTFRSLDENFKPKNSNHSQSLTGQYVNGLHWTGYLFLVQSFFFYMPYLLWSSLENGKISCLVQSLDDKRLPEEKRQLQKQSLVRYLVKNLANHHLFALKFVLIKVLSLTNLIIQIIISDALLANHFTGLGLSISMFIGGQSTETMAEVFPRAVICELSQHWSDSPSNGSDNNQVICLLPINLITEKIFIFLWFWYLFLIIGFTFDITYYLSNFFSKEIRSMSLLSECHVCDKQHLNIVINRSAFGDWLLLRLLSNNLNAFMFSEIINNLSQKYYNDRPINAEISV